MKAAIENIDYGSTLKPQGEKNGAIDYYQNSPYVNVISDYSLSSELLNVNIDAITVYPNPTSDFVNIQIDGKHQKELSLRVCNLTGTVVLSKSIDCTGIQVIDLSDLSKGSYVLTIEDKSNIIFNQKLIKK